jgi:serine/threonine protein kinase
MSSSAPCFQPDYTAPVIQELLAWLPKHSVCGTNGSSKTPDQPFMPLPDLQSYLKAENRTNKLLRALSVEGVDQGLIEKHYLRVLTILTDIGKGEYIVTFIQHQNLRDSRLPFLEKPTHFPIDPSDPKFWDSFFKKQFTFCPHSFGDNENSLKLEDHCILPIISKEVLGHGGSAAIHKIKLHPHYDQLIPVGNAFRVITCLCSQPLVPQLRMVQANSARPANTYVLKTYNTKDAAKYYANEVDAFMKLNKKGHDESLIKLLGSYKQGDTYNILLEYADRGTLEDFFLTTPPPSLGEEIIVFWSRLFNVIKALHCIHETERPDDFRGPAILIG